MDPLNLDQLDDPFLLPLLETFDTFSDLNFNFNNLSDVKPEKNTLEYFKNTHTGSNNSNEQLLIDGGFEALLNDQFNLQNIELFQSESDNTQTSSNSGSPGTVYEQSAGTPESLIESSQSLSPLQSINETKQVEFDFDDQCEKFLSESFDFGGVADDKMEIVVEKGTCIELDDSCDSDDDDSESYKNDLEKFSLTSEEKQVFIKEGYKIPTHMPLTKSEEKLLKLVRRKIRNKKSAHNSRERKKKYVNGLEKRVEYCTKMNETLSKENKLLKNQNVQLVTKLKEMQKCMNELFRKHKRTSTAMLFVSFLVMFFVYPTADPAIEEKHVTRFQSIPFKGYSRTLLSADSNMSSMTPVYSDTTEFEKLYNLYKERYDL